MRIIYFVDYVFVVYHLFLLLEFFLAVGGDPTYIMDMVSAPLIFMTMKIAQPNLNI